MKRRCSRNRGFIALHVYRDEYTLYVGELRMYCRRNDKEVLERIWNKFHLLYPNGYIVGEIDTYNIDIEERM